jgi:hypothetical protein
MDMGSYWNEAANMAWDAHSLGKGTEVTDLLLGQKILGIENQPDWCGGSVL